MNSVIDPATHFWTTRKQPTISGSSPQEKGNTVKFVLNNQEYTVTIDENGYYEWTPPFELNDGEYSLSIYIVDQAQNVGIPKQVILHIDTTAPDKPEILRVIDDQGAQQGWLTPGARTDDTRPAFSGRAEAGSVVHLYDGGTLIGSATADSTGGWEITPVQELQEGDHAFTVTSTDGRGHVSTVSNTFTMTIGADAPAPLPGTAVITHAEDNAGTWQGTLTSGALTDDLTPTLHGTAPAGSSVRIQYSTGNGQWIDGGLATLNGTDWSWTPDPALGEGHWEFRASAGASWTDEFTLDIDLTPDSELEITHAWDDAGPYTGRLDNGAVTDDRTPTLYGRAEANRVVYIHFRNIPGTWELLGSTIAGIDGQWTYDSERLAPGSYEFQADGSVNRDINGNIFNLQIAADISSLVLIEEVIDDVGLFTGPVATGGTTDDSQPTVKGKAEANSVITIKFIENASGESFEHSVQVDSSGHWEYTPEVQLDAGDWDIKVKNTVDTDWQHEFHFSIKNNLDTLLFSEYFSAMKTGLISGPFRIDGAKVSFSSGVQTRIDDLHASRVLKFGTDGLDITGKIIIDLDYLASNFSIYLLGIEDEYNPAEITAFDKDGNIIDSITATRYNWKKYFLHASDTLISKVVIEVKNESNGIVIDDVSYEAVEYKTPEPLKNDENNIEVFNSVFSAHSTENFPVTVDEILKQGEENIFIEDGKTQLMVNGNEGDVVQLADILPEDEALSGWTQEAGTVTVAGVVYNVYSHGEAELLVQEGVKTELM